ncbi:hypothetical protein ZWY2020_052635 [Hordeum vulgare]|nr:hypothetical protein ZWY2020_052635 [Hordeum vulgare]
MARPHAVVVPHPSSGNINPALQLAKLLHQHGVYITFVNTEHNHRVMETTEGATAVRGHEGFRFEAIPDGLVEADRDRDGVDYDLRLSAATSQRCAEPLKELLLRLNGTAGVPPVTCVLPTALMSFALDVARELGVPSMVLWCCSAASLMAEMRLRELKERGYVPLKDESCLTNGYLSRTLIDWIPGMPPIRLGDMSSFVRTTDPDDFGLRFSMAEANGCTKAGVLILNTFDDLEAEVLAALRAEYPRMYTVGPLGSLLNNHLRDDGASGTASGLSLWKQDNECLAWLDTQKPGSVVYANFGSLTVLSTDQLAEFAWGLAASGHPFIWSIRDNLVPGAGAGLSSLPAEFVAATAGRCCLTTWCPQDQVLGHPSVGCFLTHNGWNSTCEGVAAGVPMVCWPGFADQYTNCKYACEVWGVGLRLDEEVGREQVASHVRHAMKAAEMRESAAGWKAKAEEAVAPGGVSRENLRSMVRELGPVNIVEA